MNPAGFFALRVFPIVKNAVKRYTNGSRLIYLLEENYVIIESKAERGEAA